jgi:8-oxo-dGTP diphosphatase
MIFAAGGLLWRDANGDDETKTADGGDSDDGASGRTDGSRRLAVVHRPRYDDWSLPKGKLEAGESLAETAVREVREETGWSVRRNGFAGRYQYDVAAGPKSVFVWHMRADEPVDAPDNEVDELAWLSTEEALDRLTYDLERDLLRRVGSDA